MKMVQQCETAISHSLPFRQAILLMCFCALSSSNYIHPIIECDNQDESCEDITALDFGEQSSQVRNLQHLEVTLDEKTLLKFPVLMNEHIKWINIAKEIWNSHSAEFGVELLGMERIAVIDKIISKNPETANVRILWQWLSGKGRKPVTFRTLISVLHKIGFNEIANKMATTCEIRGIMDIHYKPALAKEYSKQLSGKYEKEFVIDSMQWLPRRLHGRNITFVDLELKENGNSVLLIDLFDDIQSGTRILFVGRPGVGKTTIIRHLAKVLIHTKQFYLVIKLHLGVTGIIDSLGTLLQANADESFDSDDINVIVNYIEKTLGEGVCFLLDGFDEYDGSDYVASLIQGEKLAKSVVIVTSRPSATEDIKIFFQRKVEIIGFGEKGILTYLKQLELSQLEYKTIYQYLDTHPNIRQLCYLPLHLSMLVYIAVDTIGSGIHTLSLVDTETELYTDFLFLTIKQYEFVRHEQTVKSLKECFDDIYKETDLCVLLRKISENAFEGVMSREQTFTSSSFDGLLDSIDISAEIENLSLFKIEAFYDRRGNKLHKYYYSHPTFQEFFAAFHLTTFPREEQLIYIKHFWMHEVYKFFLGLIGNELKYDNETVHQMFVSFAREDLATYQDQDVYVMKCAHEVRRGTQFINYLQAVGVITISNSVHVYMYHNHDCWYIGYTLAQSPLYELIVDKHSELALCISFIKNYLKHDPKTLGSVNVTKLTLGDDLPGYWPWFTNREDSISTVEILEFLPAFQNDLTHLALTFLKFEHSASVLNLGKTLKSFRKLQFLALSVSISVIKTGHLEHALKDLAHLEHLELGVINKHDDDTAIPEDLLEFKSLKQLQSLTLCISWNKDLVDVNMTALIGGLKYLTELKTLTFRIILYSGFRDNGATELFQGIESVSSINDLALHLDLCWELGLGNVTIEELASVLSDLTVLRNLSLCIDFNFSGIQGSSGVIELAEGLKELTELQELRLELRWELQANDGIDEAAIALANGLKHLHGLSTLELSLKHNGSCSEIVSLFKSLTQLQELRLGWKSLGGKTDVVKLISGLKHLRELRKLDLSWNNIGDDDVVPLIEALSHMNHLDTLDLSHNKIGDAGVKLLAEVVESLHLSHLQVLLLNDNEFSDVGAKILSEKVIKLSKLYTLDFGLKLGAYSAQALALIHQQKTIKQPVFSSNGSSDETCDFMLYLVAQLITLGTCISALVGGFLCYVVLHSSSVLTSEASSNRILLPIGISETLAQGIFSTSSAWKLERIKKRGLDGTGTVIVILDTAVDLGCPAFLQKNISVVDCLPQLPVASVEHGCVCAAVAVGSAYNTPSTIVPSGVAPGAQLIVYRVAEGEYCYNEAVLLALDDMKEKIENGLRIDVVSISYDFSEDNEEEIRRKIEVLTEKGVVFVAAAGNRGRYQAHASIPACFDNVISVGALDKDGFPSRFNACGRIDVFAPGEDIPTPSSANLFWGTSFATPAVSGLVLLLKQCADKVGSPARDYIHDVKILRSIFKRHMITRSDSGQVDVFDPVGFFLRVIDNPNSLNEIVENLNTEDMEQ